MLDNSNKSKLDHHSSNSMFDFYISDSDSNLMLLYVMKIYCEKLVAASEVVSLAL